MKRAWVAMVAVLLACGPSGGEQDAAAILDPQIGEIRAAAGNGDRGRARQELEELRSTVANLRRSEDLTEQKAKRILEAADEVERFLGLISPPRPTPLRRSPSPSPPPKPAPTRTQEPSPTREPEPSPTQAPEPTQDPDPPDNNEGSGDNGQDGVPGLLREGN